ncbi:MAG TPA: hypothetical protein VFB78_03800 [Acidimicrobiales bacterium]|nr:hypothetical protein [Acidimicrobiales bacterium]
MPAALIRARGIESLDTAVTKAALELPDWGAYVLRTLVFEPPRYLEFVATADQKHAASFGVFSFDSGSDLIAWTFKAERQEGTQQWWRFANSQISVVDAAIGADSKAVLEVLEGYCLATSGAHGSGYEGSMARGLWLDTQAPPSLRRRLAAVAFVQGLDLSIVPGTELLRLGPSIADEAGVVIVANAYARNSEWRALSTLRSRRQRGELLLAGATEPSLVSEFRDHLSALLPLEAAGSQVRRGGPEWIEPNETMVHPIHGRFWRDSGCESWWTKDDASHAGCAWKEYEEVATCLEWRNDIDPLGAPIAKHKSAPSKRLWLSDFYARGQI